MVEAAAGAPIDVIPSVRRLADLSVTVGTEVKPGAVEAVAFLVATDGPLPTGLAVDREALAACGFDGRPSSARARTRARPRRRWPPATPCLLQGSWDAWTSTWTTPTSWWSTRRS